MIDGPPSFEQLSHLHPDHVKDLAQSGLNAETILALGIHTVPARQIAAHLGFDNPQIESLLCFPYLGTAGFCRDKLFPPLKDKDGHTVRYLQRKNSKVHLYIPPLARQVLSDPTIPLFFTEGEKKAARLCQEGFPCIGIGGLWNWVQDGKPTEDLDLIVWEGRQTILVPDSDVWANRPDLLHAVYAFGAEQERRGAYNRVLVIPSTPGAKTGADDLLVQKGKEALLQCERLPLSAPIFSEARTRAEGRRAKYSNEHRGATESAPGLALTPLRDLLEEPEEAASWLVEGLLPAGGFSVIAAKPKAGKSTFARNLALSIAQGVPFLSRPTQSGGIVYLALEEKRSEVRKHFRDMGATGNEEIYVHAASAPADALTRIRTEVEEKKPALLIVDPLFRLTRVKDSNDYAQVMAALEPLLTLARETGTHVLCVHHAGKGEREGADSILGSTAIFASVDTAIILKRSERYRTISSVQRYGDDLPETVLHFDPQTRTITLGQSKGEEEVNRLREGIIDFLRMQSQPMTEPEIKENVEGNNKHKQTALRELVKEKFIERTGSGKKGDSYRFSLSHFYYREKSRSEHFAGGITPGKSEDNAHFSNTQFSPVPAKLESEKSEQLSPGSIERVVEQPHPQASAKIKITNEVIDAEWEALE